MKIRVKVRASGSRHSVTVEQPEDGVELTVERIKHAIYHQIPALPDGVENAESILLSLNGNSPLSNSDDELASEAGIVSGDLVHLLNGDHAGGPGLAAGTTASAAGGASSGLTTSVQMASSASFKQPSSSRDRVDLRDNSSNRDQTSTHSQSNRDTPSTSGSNNPNPVLARSSNDGLQRSSRTGIAEGALDVTDMEAGVDGTGSNDGAGSDDGDESNDGAGRNDGAATVHGMIAASSCFDYKEGEVLPWLLNLFVASESPATKVELIFILVHVLFLEKNFYLSSRDNERDENVTSSQSANSLSANIPSANSLSANRLPTDWKRKVANKLDLVYRHPKCGDEVEFVVTFINMFGTVVVVNAKARLSINAAAATATSATSAATRSTLAASSATSVASTDSALATESQSFKIQIKPDDYLTPDCLSANSSSSHMYRDLRRFSVSLLDSVVNNVLNEGLSLAGGDDEASIFSLPYDVSVKILSNLDFRSLARMTAVNHFFRDFCATSQFLWKNLLVRDFPSRDIPSSSVDDWKEAYKQVFVRHRRAEQRRAQNLPFFQPNPTPLNPYQDDDPFAPPPFMPPGFLGGDRDLLPGGLPIGGLPFHDFNDPFRPIGPRGFRPPGPRPNDPRGFNPMRPRWPGPGGGSGGGGYFF